MANEFSETVPLLQLNTSEADEDLDESRETETTDDESLSEEPKPGVSEPIIEESKPGCSYWVQPGPSGHSNNDDQSPNSSCSLDSQVGKGQEAISYFTGDKLVSSSDSIKVSSITSSVDLGYVLEYTYDEDGNIDYVDVDFDDTISEQHLERLMKKMSLNHYTAISCEGDAILAKCRGLFQRDYYCDVIANHGGNLSRHYPARIIIPVARKSEAATLGMSGAGNSQLRTYYTKIKKSVWSRLLTRFVVPVIWFDNKFICRSGSLTNRKTAVYESARQKEEPRSHEISASVIQQIARKLAGSLADFSSRTRRAASQLFFPNSMAKLRYVDAEILRDLNIQHICDLMVEDRKMFKQTIRVSSSEKINRDIFKDSAIEQMPYPGCSFFRRYHDADRNGHRLVFDWNRSDVNVEMRFSIDPYEIFPDVNWTNYKEWDLINLTKNYLKMMLHFLAKDTGGMLIHCISGWDRTPLFISLLRISLWVDGLIHESLNYTEIAYLTLAYDWYLFGHNFPLRLSKKQDIMYFCFNFLVHIVSDEFSLTRMFHELPDEEKRGRTFPEYHPDKRIILRPLGAYVMDTFEFYVKDIYN